MTYKGMNPQTERMHALANALASVGFVLRVK
jgi:predicted dienelactone hydrolase